MIDVIVLTGPQVNWGGYIEFIKSTLDLSPTRCLDKLGYSLNDPISILASLNDLREQDFNPRNKPFDTDLLNHSFYSFAALVDYQTAEKILVKSVYLKISTLNVDRDSCILILTGTVLDWKNTLPDILNKRTTHYETKLVFSKIFTLIKSTDLKNLWRNYRIVKEDTTWSMEKL